MTTDWVAWHDPYFDPDSPLSRRLRSVQRQIGVWLDETAPRDVMILSLCAGDGRDLLGVLDARNDARRVRATLVEISPELADRARAAGGAAGLVDIDVHCADAGTPEAYAGCAPADLVLPEDVLTSVGVHELTRQREPAPRHTRLFTFVR